MYWIAKVKEVSWKIINDILNIHEGTNPFRFKILNGATSFFYESMINIRFSVTMNKILSRQNIVNWLLLFPGSHKSKYSF